MTAIFEPVDGDGKGPLERDVQAFLAENLSSSLGESLTLIGTEYSVAVGRIDILAQDAQGCFVVVELKLGAASRDAIGQLQSYMGALAQENPETFVRGVLVAASIDPGAEAALQVARDIQFVSYILTFKFFAEFASRSTFQEWKERGKKPTVSGNLEIWLPTSFKK